MAVKGEIFETIVEGDVTIVDMEPGRPDLHITVDRSCEGE